MKRSAHVLVLGGGVAGLSAAHELAERNYRVTLIEANETLGGKARTIAVPGTGRGGRRDLPGEHGFRFFPRFYRHVVDTMARIPFGANPRGVADNLVDTSRMGVAEADLPIFENLARFPAELGDVRTLRDAIRGWRYPVAKSDARALASALWRIASTCRERRQAELDDTTWAALSRMSQGDATYQSLMGLTQIFVALRAQDISAATTGTIMQQMVRDLVTPGGSSDRVLAGPTSEAWLDPWREHLLRLGVEIRTGLRVRELHVEQLRVAGVSVEGRWGRSTLDVEQLVCALPLATTAQLADGPLARLDPQLAALPALAEQALGWMVGAQLFLRRPVEMPHGHVIHLDTPWALTSVAHELFWSRAALQRYGQGRARTLLSVDISDWDAPGLRGKPARECSGEELRAEVWDQLCAGLPGLARLSPSEDLVGWMLDPALTPARPGREASNADPLFVNAAGTRSLRPDPETLLDNLVLAGDYVATDTELASMEGANEAARRAVNAVLARTTSSAERCPLWRLREPTLTAPLRIIDRIAWQRGRAWPWGRRLAPSSTRTPRATPAPVSSAA